MYAITKEFHFSASHRLHHLPEGHPCARLHGHNYAVIVELGGQLLNGQSFIRDYGDLKAFQGFLDAVIDHRHICGLVDDPATGIPRFVLANTPSEVVASELEQTTTVATDGTAVMQPATAENMARAFYKICRANYPEVLSVRVSETPKTWATYGL
jgi:6-pyruvoyltetrahydropterin/6-carboxytetrahydropterin synthase